jgi:tetratricopeptide (TPR) repeat protein
MRLFFSLYFIIKINQLTMKRLLTSLLLLILFTSCSENVKYTPEQIKQTSGRYIFNQDDVIDVFYENNDLYINWKSGRTKPVALDEKTFFVPDMYKKLRFVKHPDTKKRYLAIVSEDDENKVEYAYPKVADTYKTARMYLTDQEFDKALAGYIELRKQDSTKTFINEREVNTIGYNLLRKKEYKKAIEVFEINVVLYPESDNVYDSLGEAHLRKGDSLEAFNNFKKCLTLNSGNQRAKEFVKLYGKKADEL